MMRVVLDTNIVARVVMSPRGPAWELFDLMRSDHELMVSLEMLAELARVLAYDRVRRIHKLDDRGIEEFVKGVASGAHTVRLPESLPRVVPHDADDDLVLATAVAGQADVICTRNRHLYHEDVLAYCTSHAIKIMDDLALLTALRQQ
jgi:putative PIN family toxin of toxin-antitoxin system